MQQCYKWSNSSFASENSVFESMNRAIPYSPEEKKERIERYRSKRNLRNFNKKIKVRLHLLGGPLLIIV